DLEVDYKELRLAISEFPNLEWKGKPNLLSKDHVCWDIIYRTAEAVKKPLTMTKGIIFEPYMSVSKGMLSYNFFAELLLINISKQNPLGPGGSLRYNYATMGIRNLFPFFFFFILMEFYSTHLKKK
ncbi:nitroreductase family, partial [Olea europaea subsp. europaea]